MIKKLFFFAALYVGTHGSAIAADSAQSTALGTNVHWACHMTTASGVSGLVMVDIDSKADAEAIALRSKALNDKEVWELSKSVVECVQMPGGKFSDKMFQARYSIMAF